MRKIILVGATGKKLKPNWRDYARAPQAPSNYKDPDKIEAYIQEKEEALESRILNETGILTDFTEIQIGVELHAWSGEVSNGIFFNQLGSITSDYREGIILGDNAKGIIRTLFREPRYDDSWFYDPDWDAYTDWKGAYRYIHDNLLENSGVRFMTLEEFLFTREERELLLTGKLLNCDIDRKAQPVAYMQAVLEKFGYGPKWHTMTLKNGGFTGKSVFGI